MNSEPNLDDVDQIVIRRKPGAWLETCGHIIDKSGNERGIDSFEGLALHANWLQRRIFEIAQWCLDNNVPCRLLVYKPRQKGCSTGTMGLAYWWSRRMRCNCLLMGGQYSQVENLWGIMSHYHARDRFDWGNDMTVLTDKATCTNGSEWQWETARDSEAGRSGTYQVAVLTEVARWSEQGISNASVVLNGVQNCVPKLPGTLVILETTVKGGFGEFFHKWQGDREKNVPGAVTFEEFKRGKRGNGWIKVFAPWFMFEDSWLDVRDEQESADIMNGVGAISESEALAEKEMTRKFKLKPQQIKYWRDVLINECQRDPDNRDREYPPTPEAGFKSTMPSRFSRLGLQRLRAEAERAQGDMRRAILEDPQKTNRFFVRRDVVGDNEADFLIYESPRIGRRYVLTADLAGGAEVTEGGDTDCHTLLVLRDGYMDTRRGVWVKPKVVATCKPGCRIDQIPLAHLAWKLARYYGGCLIVPEANYDRGFIRELRNLGAHVYERERPATEKDDNRPTGKYGFWTKGTDGEQQRGWCIEQVAKAVREWDIDGSGLDCPALHVLAELEFFVRKENGREEAAPGKHDDWVIALALALVTLSGGTLYHAQVGEAPNPRHQQRAMDRAPGAERPSMPGLGV